MKNVHLGAVIFTMAVVVVVIVAATTGGWETAGANSSSGSSAGPQSNGSNSMSVENVSVRNQTTDGVVSLDIRVDDEFNKATLGHALAGLYNDSTINVSNIDFRSFKQNVATVAVATDDRSSSSRVVRRVEHYLHDTNWSERSTTQTDGSDVSGTDAAAGVCTPEPAFYQIDFVQGGVIKHLGGPNGTYLPDELIRFAHGSSEQPIVRTSDGMFTTNRSLRDSVENRGIVVENGTATVTFSVAAGHGPVKLTLASYTKPGRYWSRETEHLQKFVDADTQTFASGGPYTLHVDLPEATNESCETPEATPTATSTAGPTTTPAGETPSSTPISLQVDWRSVYNGKERRRSTGSTPQALFELGDVKPGDGGKAIIGLHNDAGPTHIRMGGELMGNDENGANEPERSVEKNPGGEGDGELADALAVTVYYAEDTDPGNDDVKTTKAITSGSLSQVMADLNDGVALDYNPNTGARDPYPSDGTGYLVFEWDLPIDVGNEVQSDSVAFSLDWVAQQAHSDIFPRLKP